MHPVQVQKDKTTTYSKIEAYAAVFFTLLIFQGSKSANIFPFFLSPSTSLFNSMMLWRKTVIICETHSQSYWQYASKSSVVRIA